MRIAIFIVVGCFDNGNVGKQQVAWKKYGAQYWLKELQESIVRCTGRRDITEILLKTPLNFTQFINQSSIYQWRYWCLMSHNGTVA